MTTKPAQILALMNELSGEELQNLVPAFNQLLKAKRAQTATRIVSENKFAHNSILSWISTKGRTRGERFYFRFQRMNRAGTAAQGPQCTKDGAVIGGTCTVAPMYIDIVDGKIIK